MKILIKKQKKALVEGREFTVLKQKKYFVTDSTRDFHTEYEIISKKDLTKTGEIKSNTGKDFSIFDASFIDIYKKIKRLAQMPLLKDIGMIIAFTGINKDSKIVDAGAGSGGIACFLAHIAKEVTTYDINKENIDVVKQNKDFLKLKNLKIKNKDVYRGIDEKDIDVITLDLPSPHNAVSSSKKALKIGGFLVNYSPCITSSADFVNTILKNENFIHLKTIELISRDWKVQGRAVRPASQKTIHSGFLTFCRKIK